jgi:ankyrin repeat protein
MPNLENNGGSSTRATEMVCQFLNEPSEHCIANHCFCSLKCLLVFKIDDQERTRMFLKDIKPRPKPPKRHMSPSERPPKSEEMPIHRSLSRNKTLPPSEYPYPYVRVHYQRCLLRRTSVERRWNEDEPEFERLLTALPPMHCAAATGNVERLDELLQHGDSPSTNWQALDSLYRHDRTGWDFSGAPPIHFAAYYGHSQAVLFLLSNGADIDGLDAAGTTALHAAAWTGNSKLFQTLLRRGADSSIRDYDGWSVAVYAMLQGHECISRLIFENCDGDTATLLKANALRHAAKLGNIDTALAMASEHQALGEMDQAETMLFTEALMGAAEGGHDNLVRQLLDLGADASVKDDSGSTALHWAAWGGHAVIENQMYDERDKVQSRCDGGDGDAPSLSRWTSECHESVIQLLLDAGADVNAQNSLGSTPLHWVSGAGCAPIVQCLLDHGADVNTVDKQGRTATHRAVKTGDSGLVTLLQPRGQSLS